MAITVVPASVTIDHCELPGSPTEQQDSNGRFIAKRILRCAWADRNTLATQIVGRNERAGDNVTCYMPQVYPNASNASVRARTFAISPWQDNEIGVGAAPGSRIAIYKYAKVEITYDYAEDNGGSQDAGGGGGTEEQQKPNPIIRTDSIVPESEVLTMPAEDMRWKTGSKLLTPAQVPVKHSPLITFVITFQRLPYLGTTMLDYAGYLNSSAMYSRILGKTFAINTLLYQPGSFSRDVSADGSEAWRAELRFICRDQTWLKFWNPAASAWDTIQVKNGGTWSDMVPYPSANLNTMLFTV